MADLILRLKGRVELEGRPIVFSYTRPLVSHVEYLQRCCHIASQEKFSFQKGDKNSGAVPKVLTFLRAWDSLDDSAFDVAKETLAILSHSVLGSRDFDAPPLKTGVLKFQSRKKTQTTLSGKKPKNCALFQHFLFIEDVRSDKPRQILSLEYYNLHKLYDEASSSSILLLVLNTDVFQFEKDLMVCVAKNRNEVCLLCLMVFFPVFGIACFFS